MSKELSGLVTVLFTEFENVAEITYNDDDENNPYIKIMPKSNQNFDEVTREITRRVDELSENSSYHYLTKIKGNQLHVYIRDLNE